jgi:hypothetical protein
LKEEGTFLQRQDGDYALFALHFKENGTFYRGRMVIMLYLHYILKKTEHFTEAEW